MADTEIDLLAVHGGTITAPAGCGKTHLIAQALTRHSAARPILVLTHTNAGVVALRARMDKAGVRPGAYRLSTIDGWAMRLVSTFPVRGAINPDVLKLETPGSDYPAIRLAACEILGGGHISDALAATYSRLIVDEYQDCSQLQHLIVQAAAVSLPTCVLGDPLQAIFGFGSDHLADWTTDVCVAFPVAGKLSTPWRWRNAGTENFGQWLLSVRENLLTGLPIDLTTAPPEVRWVHLDGTDDHRRRQGAAQFAAPHVDGVLVIGDATDPAGQRRIAGQTPGAVTVEAVDLKDLVAFARNFDLRSPGVLAHVANFAQSVMTNVGANDLVHRVDSLRRGTARKAPSDVEASAIAFANAPSFKGALDLLVEINKEGGVRSHRPGILRACQKALASCDGADASSFYNAAVRVREQTRLVGRPLPKRAVGSTLLLKGLEADVAVILNASGMNAANLYVAMTRGSKALVICSPTSALSPS